MKNFIKTLCLIMALATFVSCFASCGGSDSEQPKGTEEISTDSPDTAPAETDSPSTLPTETEPSGLPDDTDKPIDTPLDPTFDPDEEESEEMPKKMIFEYDFASGTENAKDFTIALDSMALTEGVGYKNTAQNGIFRVDDTKIQLKGKSVMVEADITFDVLPHKADGVTNFPLSVITWIRKDTAGNTTYDWAIKMDENGTLYIKNTTTPTQRKIEAGKRHTFGVLYDENEARLFVYLDGELVATNGFSSKELTQSSIRCFDGGAGKAHFSATLHSARAYLCSSDDMLKDAERSVYDAIEANPDTTLCFVGITDKDALSYKVGEEMTFEIYLTANNEVVSAPYFYYSVEGEDGQSKTEGYADGSKGHFTVKAKMSKPGALRVKAYICDENKVKQTKNNSKLYIDLETTTPQKADLMFKGGAIAGLEQINAGGKIPTDLKEFWDGVIADCYEGDIKLLRFDKLDPAKFGGANTHLLYLVEIESKGGFVTGYLSYPIGKEKLALRCGFVSYGNAKKPSPVFLSESACFNICAHSYHLDDPNAIVPDKNGKSYGFYMPENNDKDTVYFKNMFIRNITATRFLKAYIGDGSYGNVIYNGETLVPLNKWSKGDDYYVQGGSQASFQSVAMAAFDTDVTRASFGVPWFCDIGGDLVGRFSGWNPDYTDALMYYDSVALATLIESDVSVTITAGLGDTTSEPSGVVALYNALNCPVTMSMTQNREHTYNPPFAKVYKVSK